MRWYCYTTRPQKEFIAREILTRNGLNCIVPTEIKHRRRSRHAKARIQYEAPLMRGYVFVETLLWWQPFQYNLFTSIVGHNGNPTVIPEQSIDYLKSLDGKSFEPPKQNIRPGQTLTIKSGPLAGHVAKIQQVRGKKATAFINMLCGQTPLTLDVVFFDEAA